MNLPSVIPWYWKAGAVVALAAVLLAGGVAYRSHVYQLGHADAVAERAAQDAVATLKRVGSNIVLAEHQGAINTFLTKAKYEELAPVRERIVTQRVYVGSAICNGPAATTEAESAAGGDEADPSRRLVRQDAERDIRALKLAVEEDLATARTCQGFIEKNGMSP